VLFELVVDILLDEFISFLESLRPEDADYNPIDEKANYEYDDCNRELISDAEHAYIMMIYKWLQMTQRSIMHI
jgi:hypothetical protein